MEKNQTVVTCKIKDITYDGLACKMLIMSDITPSIAFDKLQRVNDKLKLLQGCYSHDMKTPLEIVQELAESALAGDDISDQIRSFFIAIRYAS